MKQVVSGFLALAAVVLHCPAYAAAPTFTSADGSAPTARSIALDKVVKLIDDLRTKVGQEAATEAKAYAKYEQWCGDETSSVQASIGSAESDMADEQTTAQASVAEADVMRTKLEHAIGAVSLHENDMKEASALRQKERKQFEEADASLSSAIGECERAIEILSRKPEAEELSQVSMALTQVIARAAATPNNLQSFFQSTLSGQQQTNFLQSAAPPKSEGVVVYSEGHSQQVQASIRDFQQFTEEQRASIRREEASKQNSYDLLEQAMQQELKIRNDAVEQKKLEISEQQQIQASSGQSEVDAKQRRESLEAHLEDVASECEQKHRENQQRTESRSKEMLVLQQAAKLVKQSGEGQTEPYALLQLRMAPAHVAGRRGITLAPTGPLDKTVSLLQVQARQTAKADPFQKVKRMVENMITKLVNEAAGEQEHNKWCTQETAQAKDQRKTHEHQHQKFASKATMLEGNAADTAEKLSEVSQALATMNTAAGEAAEVRKTETTNAAAAVADYVAAQKALRAAVVYLNKFYQERKLESDKVFLQARSQRQLPSENKPDDPSAGKEGRQKDRESSAQAVLDLLEIMVSDFVKMQLEVETEEATALRDYTEYDKSYAAQKAASQKEVEHLETMKKRIAVEISEMTQERDSAAQEVGAMDEYLEKLAKNCQVGDSFEVREEKRQKQIEGLQQALTAINTKTEVSVSVL